MNQGDVPVTQTLNHELFAWQLAICVPDNCLAENKQLWAIFWANLHNILSWSEQKHQVLPVIVRLLVKDG